MASMVVVTAIAIALFAAPLVIAFGDLHREEEVVRLERALADATSEVPASFPDRVGEIKFPVQAGQPTISLYGRDRRLIAGSGPKVGDVTVRAGLNGDILDRVIDGHLVVGVPFTRGEQILGALRASVPISVVTNRTRNVVLVMAGIGFGALLITGLIALWQSRRLARPVGRLAVDAARLGDGDFTVRAVRSGVPEVDAVSGALETTAVRLDAMLSRERRFSEDASHQLRTPLTSLRVTLEGVQVDPTADTDVAIDLALDEIDRLDQTIDDLLALAREVQTRVSQTDLPVVLTALDDDWRGRLSSMARPLRVIVDSGLPEVGVSERALRQILDVLIENAVRHGSGAITVRARSAPDGAVVEVSDEGPGVVGDEERIFERRVSTAGRTGIGLALARSLAEAEGGRLVLSKAGPEPTFAIVLPVEGAEGLEASAGDPTPRRRKGASRL